MGRKASINRSYAVSGRNDRNAQDGQLDTLLIEPEELEEPELLEFAYLTGPKRLGNTEFEWDDLPNWEPLLNNRSTDWK